MSEEYRKQAAEFLPDALQIAMKSYKEFMGSHADEKTSKEFKARHEAGKVALGHIEVILKGLETVEATENQDDTLAGLIKAAQSEVARGRKA